MARDIFAKNIALLKQKQPSLALRIETRPLNNQWYVVSAKNDCYTLGGINSRGQEVHLHSIYNPQREARQIVDTYEYSLTADLVFMGFALGYHIREVIRRGGRRSFIVIVEDNLDIIRLAFEYIDYEDILTLPNVIWFVNEPASSLFNCLKKYSISILANSVTVLEHPPSIKLNQKYYTSVKKSVSEIYTWAKVNINTHIAKSEDFSANILANIIEIIKNPGVKHLFGAFENVPIFLVSAGPSLDKNVHYLRNVRDRGIIITVDSALKTLLDKNIKPDLVVSIDFSDHNLKYLEGIDSESLVLVFDPEVHPVIPYRFKGRKFVINIPNKSLCEWITKIIGDKGRLEKGLSVSHTAFLLALSMKANPIIFLGQDLSYPRGIWHSKGSQIYQKAGISEEYKKRMGEIEDYFGGRVVTETSLKVFLSHFEGIIEGLDVDCYNATEGGAHIKGVEAISLRAAISKFCKNTINKDIIWCKEFPQNHIDENIQRVYEEGLVIIERLTRCNHNSYKAYQFIDQMMQEAGKTIFNKSNFMSLYKKVTSIIKEFNNDQKILNVIKDNATEALLIRSKRDMKSLTDGDFENKQELLSILNKERLFFTSLVKASDFLSQEFCVAINTIKEKYINVPLKT